MVGKSKTPKNRIPINGGTYILGNTNIEYHTALAMLHLTTHNNQLPLPLYNVKLRVKINIKIMQCCLISRHTPLAVQRKLLKKETPTVKVSQRHNTCGQHLFI